MGIFSKLFKGTEDTSNTLFSPVDGKVVAISQVPDPTFADEILGKGLAIRPSSDVIFSPCDGTVDMMFDTGHAVNLISESGMEILIHVGLETVSLKGKHFKTFKNSGDHVSKGDKLIEFERDQIAAEGFNTIIPVVICNSDSYSSVKVLAVDSQVKTGDKILTVAK